MPRKVSELSGGTLGQRGALGRDPRERVLGAPERTQLLEWGGKQGRDDRQHLANLHGNAFL